MIKKFCLVSTSYTENLRSFLQILYKTPICKISLKFPYTFSKIFQNFSEQPTEIPKVSFKFYCQIFRIFQLLKILQIGRQICLVFTSKIFQIFSQNFSHLRKFFTKSQENLFKLF